MRPDEVAEFDTQVGRWFGPPGDRPVDRLTISDRQGARIHVCTAPRRQSAAE